MPESLFGTERAEQLDQAHFDADLWDDALEALAGAMRTTDCARAIEAANAVAASARFMLLTPEERHGATNALAAAVSDDDFLAARQAAIAAASDDSDVLRVVYTSTARHVGATVLRPFGFPPSRLGLRSLAAAERAMGSRRAAAALGRAWCAGETVEE